MTSLASSAQSETELSASLSWITPGIEPQDDEESLPGSIACWCSLTSSVLVAELEVLELEGAVESCLYFTAFFLYAYSPRELPSEGRRS